MTPEVHRRAGRSKTSQTKEVAGAKAQRQILLLIYQLMALPRRSLGVTGRFAQGLVLVKTRVHALLTPPGVLDLPEVN